jgi:hypothetical protein
MILTKQLFARIFRNFAELIVYVIDGSALIGDGHNRGFIKRKFDVCQFLERLL